MITKNNALILLGAIGAMNDFSIDIVRVFGQRDDSPMDQIISDMAEVLFNLLELDTNDDIIVDDFNDKMFNMSKNDAEKVYKYISDYLPGE